jgi:hypothetical protein
MRNKRPESLRVLKITGALAVVGRMGRKPLALPDQFIDALPTR